MTARGEKRQHCVASSWVAAAVFHAALLGAAALLTSVYVQRHATVPDLAPVRLALGGTGAAGQDALPNGREPVASRRPAIPDLPPGEIESVEPPRVSGAEFLVAGPPPSDERASGEDPMSGQVPEHAGHGRPGAPRGVRWGSGEAGTSSETVAGGGSAPVNAQAGSGAGGPGETASSGDGGDGWARRRGGRLPSYPALARRRGWEGTATLSLDVAADGSVSAVRVADSSGHRLLDESAEEAAWTWTFAPALRDGKPEASRVTMPVTYRLTD